MAARTVDIRFLRGPGAAASIEDAATKLESEIVSGFQDMLRDKIWQSRYLFKEITQLARIFEHEFGEAPKVGIGYSGTQTKFRYLGALATGTGVDFISTNELYGPDLHRVLTELEGVTHYLGIAGGLAGVTHMCALSTNNRITGTLVDLDPTQLLFDMHRLAKYDDHPYQFLGADRAFLERNTDLGKILSQQHLDIRLEHGDIRHSIEDVGQKGVYFVYLSNAFVVPIFSQSDDFELPRSIGWRNVPLGNTVDLLRSVLDNENIKDGSLVMFATAYESLALILRKEAGTFSVHALVGMPERLEDHADRREPHKIEKTLQLDEYASFFEKVARYGGNNAGFAQYKLHERDGLISAQR